MIAHTKVTAHTFSQATDEAIVAAAREVLAAETAPLRPFARKILAARAPDVMEAGPILWAHLCRWPRAWLK